MEENGRMENLINMYMKETSGTEVPKQWHMWTCISVMAACVQNNVWIQKFAHKAVYPHLYTFLIGPSRSGKGNAIGFGLQIVRKVFEPYEYHNGRTTDVYLIKKLGRTAEGAEKDLSIEYDGTTSESNKLVCPKLFLINDELKNDIERARTEDFIALMTKLYGGEGDYGFGTSNREVHFKGACMNWLAGSTNDWLIEALTARNIASGATARMQFVYGRRNYKKRITRPRFIQIPTEEDQKASDTRMKMLVMRFKMLRKVRGEMLMTDQAFEFEDQWYQGKLKGKYARPEPINDTLAPFWLEEQDSMLRLSMLLSLADGGKLVIEKKHVTSALDLIIAGRGNINSIIELATKTPDMAALEEVSNILKRYSKIGHSTLLRKVTKKNYNAKDLKEALGHLSQERRVRKYGGRDKEGKSLGPIVWEWIDEKF